MGRELRRKQAKKEGKSLEREEIVEEKQIKKLIITTLIVFITLVLMYLLSAIFITKELDIFNLKKNTSNETVVNSILASSIFKQSDEEYYVYFYNFNETDEMITNAIGDSLSGLKVYKVDTGSAMNANYVSDASNKNAKTLAELKVIAPTIIKISGDTITEYYEKEEINDKFIN